MHHIFDHTIKPKTTDPKNRKDYYVVVDSNLRNKNIYTNPSKYSVTLDETYKYVTSVELVSSCVPTIDLVKIVTGVNDVIRIDATDVTISSGEYTGEELADELETKINASALSNFTVDYDENNMKLIFKNTSGAYTLRSAGNISGTIGIKRDTASASSAPYDATPSYKLNVQNCPYIMLRIGGLEHFHSTSGNAGIRDAFAIINIKKRFADETVTLENTNVKHFKPVMPRLAKLDIEFVRSDNTLHNFRSKEHVLIFKITTMNGGL